MEDRRRRPACRTHRHRRRGRSPRAIRSCRWLRAAGDERHDRHRAEVSRRTRAAGGGREESRRRHAASPQIPDQREMPADNDIHRGHRRRSGRGPARGADAVGLSAPEHGAAADRAASGGGDCGRVGVWAASNPGGRSTGTRGGAGAPSADRTPRQAVQQSGCLFCAFFLFRS